MTAARAALDAAMTEAELAALVEEQRGENQ
jgi:hypothetical protein